MQSDYYINLHFNQAVAQRTGYAFKIGDKGCTFHLHCEDLDPSGMYPHIVFNHSNNTCVEGVPTGSGRDYAYTIAGNEFGVCGKTVVDLKFYDNNNDATQRISTASFMIEIIPDTYTDFEEPSSPYADSLEHAKAELDEATSDLTDMDALFAQTLQDYIDAFGNTAPINPRGAYDPNVLYKPRDAVYYTSGGKTLTYLNNLECTGVDPTNTSNWQPIIDIPSLPAIIDNCTSTSTTDALSANQGRVLREELSHRNLVDNPFFTVNQRGTSGSYQNGYMADRWFAAGFTSSNVTTNITNNGAVIQSNGTYGWRVKQNIENYKDLSGRKVTYSINVKSISSDFISLFYAPSLNGINEDWVWLGNASTTGIISVTFTLPDLSSASGLCLMFQSDTPIDVTIRAVKLEPGSVSTLHLDVEPNHAFELAKCRASTADPSDTYANKGDIVNYIEYDGTAADDKAFFTDVINHVISLYGGSGLTLQFIVGGLKQLSYYYKGIGYGYFGGGENNYISLQCSTYTSVFLISTGGGAIQIRQIDGTLI